MTARGHYLGHPITWDDTRKCWAFSNGQACNEQLYTPDMAGSGQRGICAHCGKPPTPEGHDGCLGTLPEQVVMNACCGHGNDRQAYVQHWDGTASRGADAIEEQCRLIHGTMAVPARLLRGR